MKEMLVKNLHWFIIVYALFGLFTVYEENMEKIEQEKSSIPRVKNNLKKAKRKLKEIEKFKKNLSQSKERVQEVVKQIEKIQKQLPSEVNDAEVQGLIGGYANKLRIKDPSPAPGKEINNGFYYVKEYEFAGVGTYLQFLIFFEKLGKAERILNVKNLSIIMSKNSGRSRFPIVNLKTTVESFRYNSLYREKSVVNEIENKFKVQ